MLTENVLSKLIDNFFANANIYTYLRKLFAGNQQKTKNIITDNLNLFNCHSVLDICCGTGDFAEVIGSRQYLGIDINANFIDYAQERFRLKKQIRFQQGNIFNINLKKEYDAAILISTLHHFNDKEIILLIQKIKPLVKKMIIIADLVPNPPSFLARFLVHLDRGCYIREKKDKIKFLIKDFNIIKTRTIREMFAYQFIITAIPKK